MKKSKKTIFKCVSALALLLSMVSVGGNIVSAGPVVQGVIDTRTLLTTIGGRVISDKYTYKDLVTVTGGYELVRKDYTETSTSTQVKAFYKYVYRVW